MNIRQLAINTYQEQIKENLIGERTLLVLGNKNTGKSTLIGNWLNKTTSTQAKRAPGLDYTWNRKSQGVVHIWEFPDLKLISKKLITSLLRGRKQSVVVVLMLNLAKPDTFSYSIDLFQSCFEDLLPVCKLVIVGGMYDTYQNFEPELKKQITKTIRAAAIWNSAVLLLYYSSAMALLVKRLNDSLNGLVWDSGFPKIPSSHDAHSPVFITQNDSFKELGYEKNVNMKDIFQMLRDYLDKIGFKCEN